MADEDWEEALRRIEATLASGGDTLDLRRLVLGRVPDEVARLDRVRRVVLDDIPLSDIEALRRLRGLSVLRLTGTPVTDLEPLRGSGDLRELILNHSWVEKLDPLSELSGLKSLDLNHTKVRTVEALRNLTGLHVLLLDSTSISDISPLAGLTNLHVLDLDDTEVRDLRPLLSLPLLTQTAPREAGRAGLFVNNTPAMDDPGIADAMAQKLWEDRRLALLDHLRSLPPWAEPFPSDPGPRDEANRPGTPDPVPAPLQVDVIDGVLQTIPADAADVGRPETQEAWQALREMLEDLADLTPGIHNVMPRLGKALARVEAALGETPDQCRPIRLGLHGQRLITLAEQAPDALMDEAGAEVQAFAAGLSLHLKHFPEWRIYRDGSDAPDETVIEDIKQDIQALVEDMRAAPNIATDVPDTLEGVAELAQETPEDPIVRKGVVDSLRNAVTRLSRWALEEARDIARKSWEGTKKAIAAGLVAAGVGMVAFQQVSGTLFALSAKPGFLWLQKVLEFLAPLL